MPARSRFRSSHTRLCGIFRRSRLKVRSDRLDSATQDDYAHIPTETEKPAVRELDTPNTAQPRIAILGSVPYMTIISNAGSGLIQYGPLAVNRWRNDATRDNRGQWCYLKDLSTGRVWSAGHQPVCAEPNWYR